MDVRGGHFIAPVQEYEIIFTMLCLDFAVSMNDCRPLLSARSRCGYRPRGTRLPTRSPSTLRSTVGIPRCTCRAFLRRSARVSTRRSRALPIVVQHANLASGKSPAGAGAFRRDTPEHVSDRHPVTTGPEYAISVSL